MTGDAPARRARPDDRTAPWKIPALPEDVVFAIKALALGAASPGQQMRALEFVTVTLCEADRMTFWPGAENGRRASDFAEGKRWVALQLRRIIKLEIKAKG